MPSSQYDTGGGGDDHPYNPGKGIRQQTEQHRLESAYVSGGGDDSEPQALRLAGVQSEQANNHYADAKSRQFQQ